MKLSTETQNLVICYGNYLPAKYGEILKFSRYGSLSGIISSVLVRTIFYILRKTSEISPDSGQIGVTLLFFSCISENLTLEIEL